MSARTQPYFAAERHSGPLGPTALRDAALALYNAGQWMCPGLTAPAQIKLWEDLRDALGLKPGHATKLGVGAPDPDSAPNTND